MLIRHLEDLDECDNYQKKITFVLVFLALLLSFSSHADLRLGPPVNPPGMFTNESSLRLHKLMFDSEVTSYAIKNSAIFRDKKNELYKAGVNYQSAVRIDYLWIFNSKKYYSSGLEFIPNDVDHPIDRCKNDADRSPTGKCADFFNSAFICHFFMLNQDLTMAGVERLKINIGKEFEGKSECIGIEAIALAKETPDAFLLIVGYKDSEVNLDAFPNAEVEANKYRTSVLVHLSEQNGKLKLTQDDSCLGNPNKYDTIAKARAALKKCHAQGK
jgi:hypothetical protein